MNRFIYIYLLLIFISVIKAQVYFSGNNHYYEIVQSNTPALGAYSGCEAKSYKGYKGYLVTINSLDEYNFILGINPLFVQDNRFWISGIAKNTDLLTYNFNSGPEKDQFMYDVANDYCPGYCNWGVSEPNFADSSEVYIHYDNVKKSWNNIDGSENSFPYICEYSAYEPTVTSAPTIGGNITITIDQWEMSNSKTYVVNFSKLYSPTTQMQCSNQLVNEVSRTINCTLPAGTGQWNLTISDGSNATSAVYKYQNPELNVFYPNFQYGEVSFLGGNLGNSLNTKITVNNYNCTNLVVVNDYTVKCKVANNITLPVIINVDGLQSNFIKIPFYYKDNTFIGCWAADASRTEAASYSYSINYKNVIGSLSYIDSQALANMVSMICPSIGLSNIYYWTSLYYNGSSFTSSFGKDQGNIVQYYSSTSIVYTPGSTSMYIYDKANQKYMQDYAYTQTGILSEFYIKSPKFKTYQTFNISTSGAVISFNLDSTLVEGSTFLKFNNQLIPFQYSPTATTFPAIIGEGYGGPYSLDVLVVSVFGNLTTSPNTQYINYNPPTLVSIGTLPSSGGIVNITGTDLFKDISLIQVRFGSQMISPIGFMIPHSQFSVQIPAGYGSRSVGILFNNNVNTNNLTFNYQLPSISSTSRLTKAGGLITIFGDNLFNNASLLQIDISGYKCSNISFINLFQNITCTMEPTEYSTVDITITLDGEYHSNTFNQVINGLVPIVKVATQGKKNQPTWISITGDSFYNQSLSVSIGGEDCQQILYINRTNINCLFAGQVAQPDKYSPLFVNVTVDGLTGGQFVFNYEEDKDCKVNCVHGKCNRQTGVCDCEDGWLEEDCSKKVDSGGNPSENNGTVTNPGRVNFTTSITHLREVNSDNNPVKTLSMVNIEWYKNNLTGEYTGRFSNETVVVRMNITTYTQSTTIVFAGQEMNIPANSAKYVISVSNWTFDGSLNTLQVVYMSQTNKTIPNGCKSIDTIANQVGSDSYLIIAGESILQAKFASYVILDNRIVRSRRTVLDDNDPIVIENSKPNQFTMATAVVVGYFSKEVIIDPSFNSLLTDINKSDCSTSNWKLPVIIVCSVAGGVAVSVGIFLYVKKKQQMIKFKKEIKMKS